MLTEQDVLSLAAQPARGKRPQFVADPVVDRMMSVTLGLVAELAVARERIDTLERVLERRGLLAREDIEHYVPEPAAARERGQLQEQYLMQVFRVLLQDDGTPLRCAASTSVADGAERTGEPGNARYATSVSGEAAA